jgi:hypothetical protein
MIIDAHAHADEYKLFGWIDPPERIISLMDRTGIDISIVTTYAEAPFHRAAVDNLVNYVNRFPERLLGFVRIDPKGAEEAVRVFEHTIRTQPRIKGMKLHPISNLIKPYSPFCTNLLRSAAKLDVPVFIHCCDKPLAQPLQIGKAAELCPETTIICHMGGFFRGEEIIRVAQKHSNILLDTSSIPYPRIILQALEAIGPDRIVFASDNPAGDPVSELAKIRNLKLSPEIEEKILYKNIARLLKLDLAGGRLK